MTDERRIITPQEFMSRQNRRAGLVDENKRLAREVDIRSRMVRERDAVINAMNEKFTHLAGIVGTPVPGSAEAEGKNCIEALFERVRVLVEREKKAIQSP